MRDEKWAVEKSCNFVLQSEALSGKAVLVMQRQEAEEHLRIIRSLMEKATVYRAIAAPTALLAGFLALIAAYAGSQLERSLAAVPAGQMSEIQLIQFLLLWGGVLVVVAGANGWFLYADARRRDEKFVSSGMKMALLSLLPSHLTALVLSHVFAYRPAVLATVWITLHGLGLLATAHFSPRSMIYLGWAFLIAGLVSLLQFLASPDDQSFWLANGFGSALHGVIPHVSPHALMAITFGGFHLVYAACTWPRGAAKASV